MKGKPASAGRLVEEYADVIDPDLSGCWSRRHFCWLRRDRRVEVLIKTGN
jgi:hypothetical protein